MISATLQGYHSEIIPLVFNILFYFQWSPFRLSVVKSKPKLLQQLIRTLENITRSQWELKNLMWHMKSALNAGKWERSSHYWYQASIWLARPITRRSERNQCNPRPILTSLWCSMENYITWYSKEVYYCKYVQVFIGNRNA